MKSFLLQSPEQQHGWAGAGGPLCYSDQGYGLPGYRTLRLVTYDTVALGEALLLGALTERERPSSGSCRSMAREEWLNLDCSGESPKHFTGGNLRSERYYLLLEPEEVPATHGIINYMVPCLYFLSF